MLVGLPVTMTTSHQCLELLLNLVFLDVSLGRLDVAMGTMDMVLFGKKDEPSSSYLEGTSRERILFRLMINDYVNRTSV